MTNNCIGIIKELGEYKNIEEIILNSCEPIEVNESEEIVFDGQRGLWTNKCEFENMNAFIEDYPINQDSNPQIINKSTNQKLFYEQEIGKYCFFIKKIIYKNFFS